MAYLGRDQPIFGKQGCGRVHLPLGVKDLNLLNPSQALAIIDLAQIEHLPLDNAAAGAALVLRQAPITMLLAIFEPLMALEKK
jgi:hypothetical protein